MTSERVEVLKMQALALQRSGDFAGAELLYREVLSIDPNNADAYHLLGLMADAMGHPDIAIGMIGQAIRLNNAMPVFYFNLGNVFRTQGRLEDSVTVYSQAVALNPQFAEAYANLGLAFMNLGKLDEAKWLFERAIKLRPDYPESHWQLAFAQMLEGDWAQGWKNMEWRWRQPGRPQHGMPGPQWDGGDLTGKTILLHSEQGLGDNIQFIRFAPMVKAKGGMVLLACPSAMERLFKNLPGIDKTFVGNMPKSEPFDYHAPLMSLPLHLNIMPDTVPAKVPYLSADPALVSAWKKRFSAMKGFKVGLVWRGNPGHTNDKNRSMNAAFMGQAVNFPGVSLVSLQKDARADELAALGKNVFDAAPLLGDLADTAAAIAALDLVISVDTAVCHLAGALGVKTWTLLPFAPDWRWMLKRSDTPWYPTMRLFRQKSRGDWGAVAEDVRGNLADLVTG